MTEKEQATLRLSAEWLEQLKQEAYELGLSLNGYLIMLIQKGREKE